MDQQLEELVESLTTSGEPQLNPQILKQLKKICKSSDENINHVYHLLMTQLNQDHAEIRLSAFQIVSELFDRSHQFRTLLISNFQEFLELTVETDYDQPLPPPREVAQKLKVLAIKTVQEWHEKYGDAYKKLSLGFHFLKQNKKVDFQDVRTQTLAQRKREEEKQKRLENIYREKANKARSEMEEMLEDIQSCLTEMQNCFKLLLPDPEEFSLIDEERDERATASETNSSRSKPNHPASHDDEQPCCSKDLPASAMPSFSHENGPEERLDNTSKESDSEESDDDFEAVEESFLRDHGLGSHKYSLNIEISTDMKVTENNDNVDVVNNLTDAQKLAKNKYWPAVQSWIQVFTKAGTTDDSLKCAIDLKKQLEAAMKKHKEMNIDCQTRDRRVMKASDDDEDEEDDFEEVPEKEGYEPRIPDHLRAEYGLDTTSASSAPEKSVEKRPDVLRRKRNDEKLEPTGASATLNITRGKLAAVTPPESSAGEPSSKCTKREEELSGAPVVPCGIDLNYWGDEQSTAGKIIRPSVQHRFWAPREAEEELESKELEAFLKTRYVTLPSKFEPVKHKCRTPLPNGSLCERQDRVKCPFHGKIIPRDELGVPTNPQDRSREARETFENEAKEQGLLHASLMRENRAGYGGRSWVIQMCEREQERGRAKKKKYPNLTDLKQKDNTSRSRLRRKSLTRKKLDG
ncbi:UV-stimulated scaffold protein A isoform X2 [Mixophyes fleayi]|uniref:UV-stimulated scaffold protein A isoform X2 n=1 Tax=Mixophyes fleayi TaxID=3061075 RepID=UPI003F4E1C34